MPQVGQTLALELAGLIRLKLKFEKMLHTNIACMAFTDCKLLFRPSFIALHVLQPVMLSTKSFVFKKLDFKYVCNNI